MGVSQYTDIVEMKYENMNDQLEQALTNLRVGKPIIIVDDVERENEGDFFMPAEWITADIVNIMATDGRGLICAPLVEDIAVRLDLPHMVTDNTSLHATAFTVSIDAAEQTTTGISTYDRYETLRFLTDPETVPTDFARPGHIFPLIAAEGGILARDGHTEAAVELCDILALKPVGVICEILSADGSMAVGAELDALAEKHDTSILAIKDLITYRKNLSDCV